MIPWYKAKIIKTAKVADDIKSIVIRPEVEVLWKAGQHHEISIPGLGVCRKYSVVSDSYSSNGNIEFGIQLIPNGALSTKLWDLKEGDELEIRGPLGESFVWNDSIQDPIVLIGAGSGITPLISIYKSHQIKFPKLSRVFIMTAKSSSRIMHYEEFKDILKTKFTKENSRINCEDLKNFIGELLSNSNVCYYICGSDSFVDDMVDNLLALKVPESKIKSERFI